MTKRLFYKNKYVSSLQLNLWGKQQPSNKFSKKSTILRVKPSEYGQMLRTKQILRSFYGNILEKHLRTYYDKYGINLCITLERRLDINIFRMKFASSVFQARQLINHGHIFVNSKKVTLSNYLLQSGDLIEVKESSKGYVYNNIIIALFEKLVDLHLISNLREGSNCIVVEDYCNTRQILTNLTTLRENNNNFHIISLLKILGGHNIIFKNLSFEQYFVALNSLPYEIRIMQDLLNLIDEVIDDSVVMEDNAGVDKVEIIKNLLSKTPFFFIPSYLEVNFKILKGIFVCVPKESEICYSEPVNFEDIKDYYTR